MVEVLPSFVYASATGLNVEVLNIEVAVDVGVSEGVAVSVGV